MPAVAVTSVTARAPAKVNVALRVGPRRPDGYHELATVLHAVSLYEHVVASPGDGVTVTVEGPGADHVPLDGTNLAARAATALAAYAGIIPNVHLHLVKAAPVAGGMAGGSADAAAALVACDALWETGLARDELHGVAAGLGSDVPFALAGGTAVGTGRGEMLTPALARGSYHWVLALADGGLSTPQVYAELDRMRAGRRIPEPAVPDRVMAALRSGDPERLAESLVNDLQPAACRLRPALSTTLDAGETLGALGGVVSGSGPTCAFLARDAEHARALAAALEHSGTCRAVVRAAGPATGARVVG